LYCFIYCFSFVYSCLFPILVQVYRPLPPGENQIAVNKYHIPYQTIYLCEIHRTKISGIASL
jgi:hypothetical protein